jgi:hypothetical protein
MTQWAQGGAGTQTAGLKFGGYGSYKRTEEYDGTTWALSGDLVVDADNHTGCGTQTAGLSFGGYVSSAYQSRTEEYNGTIWVAAASMAAARRYLAGCGTQTSGLSFGGGPPAPRATTEEYA